MALFDDGDDISVIGTGQDELGSGQSSVRGLFERNFAEATATDFAWHWTLVTVRGDTAAVAASLRVGVHPPARRRRLRQSSNVSPALTGQLGQALPLTKQPANAQDVP